MAGKHILEKVRSLNFEITCSKTFQFHDWCFITLSCAKPSCILSTLYIAALVKHWTTDRVSLRIFCYLVASKKQSILF